MLTIAKFAEAGEVGIETVRFYQRKGLLETPERDGGIRRYGDQDLRRLRFIRKAQAAGFTLEEIKELLDLDLRSDRHRAHQLASVRIEVLDKKIAELQSARDMLKKLATQCGAGSSGPCPILDSFGV
jgi:MerR family mercuric resistance operon transcriptional regulator